MRDEEAVRRYVDQMALTLTDWGLPRMPSRVLVTLMAAEEDHLSAGQLAERLEVSAAAISGAVRYLLQVGMIGRVAVRGSRRDHYALPEDAWYVVGAARTDQFVAVAELAARGAAALGGPETRAGARVAEMGDFFSFARSELQGLLERWEAHRKTR